MVFLYVLRTGNSIIYFFLLRKHSFNAIPHSGRSKFRLLNIELLSIDGRF